MENSKIDYSNLEVHSDAKTRPEGSIELHNTLKASIGMYGLMEKIVLKENKIIDGRERYKALQALGMEISADFFIDITQLNIDKTLQESPGKYGTITDLHRKHFSNSQKACFAAEFYREVKVLRKSTKSKNKETSDQLFNEKLTEILKEKGLMAPVLEKVDKPESQLRKFIALAFGISDGYLKNANKLLEIDSHLFIKVKYAEIDMKTKEKLNLSTALAKAEKTLVKDLVTEQKTKDSKKLKLKQPEVLESDKSEDKKESDFYCSQTLQYEKMAKLPEIDKSNNSTSEQKLTIELVPSSKQRILNYIKDSLKNVTHIEDSIIENMVSEAIITAINAIINQYVEQKNGNQNEDSTNKAA